MSDNTFVVDRTAADMIAARRQTDFDVPKLRDFVYGQFMPHLELSVTSQSGTGSREKWLIRQRVAEVVSRDPVFDKTAR